MSLTCAPAMAPGPRRARGTRQPAPPGKSWEAVVKARQRAENRRLVAMHDGVHPSPKCPHGTQSGYDPWMCRCESITRDGPRRWVHGDALIPVGQLWWTAKGCMPVGVEASARRRRNRRLQAARTVDGSASREPALAQVDGWTPAEPEHPQSLDIASNALGRHAAPDPPGEPDV